MKKTLFDETYARYASSIYKAILSQTHDIELAEDICQTVFFAYFRNIDTINPDSVKSWLFQTAQNALIDHWRRSSTRHEFLTNVENLFLSQTFDTMEDSSVNRIFIYCILDHIKKINRDWYNILYCVHVMQLSHEETAFCLGIPKCVIAARVYRSRKYIEKKFGNDYKGYI